MEEWVKRLGNGTLRDAYRYLGVHGHRCEGGFSYTFRVLAPGADAVFLAADFCGWDEGLAMARGEGGIFELTLTTPTSLSGAAYKFATVKDGRRMMRGDPFAFASRGGADGASLVFDPLALRFGDGEYLAARKRAREDAALSMPMNVYEVHLPSFARGADGEVLSYAELADLLLGYAKYMGYTHIELLPITEYPYDASWGYQVCAYYAPTGRHGTPSDFAAFVDRLHAGGVGVILDWVGAHFPKDEWGLYRFDGTPLYEHAVPWRSESPSWGTAYFDLGKGEVRSFLISSALFWLSVYHLDGIRVDAVSSMLYLDYDRADGEWEPGADGSNVAEDARAFLQGLCTAVREEEPGALLIAEESGDFPGVTCDVAQGGLGFHMKWNMGFSNDMFEYLATPPDKRRDKHRALNFPITYAFRERYLLPISHDEVVYGKRSLMGKIPGSPEEREACFRAFLLFFMTFPGKKLLFMGTELGVPCEWDYSGSLDFSLLSDARHDSLREYVAALNRFYLASPPLYEQDFREDGFSWLLPDEAEHALVAYLRRAHDGSFLVAVISFLGSENRELVLPLPCHGHYRVVFSSDGNIGEGTVLCTGGVSPTVTLTLPPQSGIVLRRLSEDVEL